MKNTLSWCLAALLLAYAHVSWAINPTADAITVKQLVKTTNTWDGTALPPLDLPDPQVTVLKITIGPGEKLPLHEHPVVNVGYLLSGELTVFKPESNDQPPTTKIINAGETIVELVNEWHYGQNTGQSPATIVVFYVGEKDQPVTVYPNTAH